jgi:hypothetical protein
MEAGSGTHRHRNTRGAGSTVCGGHAARSTDMNKHPKKGNKGNAKVKEYVVVAFVDDMEQAREYETLLRLNDIPAVTREQFDGGAEGKAVAIMVPEECLDEAHVVIESQDAYDDLCDYAMDEEDDLDFGGDLMDDDEY